MAITTPPFSLSAKNKRRNGRKRNGSHASFFLLIYHRLTFLISLLSVDHCRCRRPPPTPPRHGLSPLPTAGTVIVFPISPTEAIVTATASPHRCLLYFIASPSLISSTPSPCCFTSPAVADPPQPLLHSLDVTALFLYFSLL
ncbi:hypothetical protein BHM03_00049488 [Ensete ventricosum]|nr:hypothetical protein BHM03_00049488 [Ensete ventricosum]